MSLVEDKRVHVCIVVGIQIQVYTEYNVPLRCVEPVRQARISSMPFTIDNRLKLLYLTPYGCLNK